jgi:hypothetical protein
MDFLLDTVIVCATLGALRPTARVVARFGPILAAKESPMLAPMACLVVVPPIFPRFPALSRILNHRIGCPRLHPPPEWRVAARARALQYTAGSCPGPIVVDIPRGRRDAKEGVSRGG